MLVAHGIVNQSVTQPSLAASDPIFDPCADTPPVMLKDDGEVFTIVVTEYEIVNSIGFK